MKKWYLIFPMTLVTIIAFALLIYPTMYRYDKFEQKYPVKINRFTGETKILTGIGWVDLNQYKNLDSPLSSPTNSNETQIDQFGYTFEEYFELVKINAKDPSKLNKESEYFEWRRKCLGIKEYNFYPKDEDNRK